tara:strand:+ start:8875 stop:9558 length:684 start_codon:yes stop_codon:yes gene_type:complete
MKIKLRNKMILNKVQNLNKQINRYTLEQEKNLKNQSKKSSGLAIFFISLNLVFSVISRFIFSISEIDFFYLFLGVIFFSTLINALFISVPFLFSKNYLPDNSDNVVVLQGLGILVFLGVFCCLLLNLPQNNNLEDIKFLFSTYVLGSSLIAYLSIFTYDSMKKTYFKTNSLKLRRVKGEYNYYIDQIVVKEELRTEAQVSNKISNDIKEEVNRRYSKIYVKNLKSNI